MRFFTIVTIFILMGLPLLAEINECKSDIYYANGIAIEVSEKKALEEWKDILDNLSLNSNDARVAYNKSEGAINDLLESFLQKAEAENSQKITYALFRAFYIKWWFEKEWSEKERYYAEMERQTLTTQVNMYKQSIKDGHGVIVIAHSQGNLFTNRAYNKLDGWMKEYFHMMGVATPADHVAGGGPYVTFKNDPIRLVPGSLDGNIDNPNGGGFPLVYVKYHAFSYYMSTAITKDKIEAFIEDKKKAHKTAPSQWMTDKELNLNTCNYKITLKHRKDITLNPLMADIEVYPFQASKKLYQVDGKYVKASCGGKSIKDLRDEMLNGCDEENDCFLLNGTGEKIEKKPTTWKILSHQDKGTCDWRVTVENNTTHQTIDNVYPFNTSGRVYTLGSGEVVMASCGGETLLSDWADKKEYNCFLLDETKEKINIDTNITITGTRTTAECKMIAQGKNEKLSFWAEGCKYKSVQEVHAYAYSRATTYQQLPACDMPVEPLDAPFGPYIGEHLDAEVPEGYVLVDENITKIKTGTFPAYNGYSTAYTNVQKPTNGDSSVFCYGMVSAFAWSVDVYSGVLETKFFTRTYKRSEE